MKSTHIREFVDRFGNPFKVQVDIDQGKALDDEIAHLVNRARCNPRKKTASAAGGVLRVTILALVALALAACGGAGDEPLVGDTPPVMTPDADGGPVNAPTSAPDAGPPDVAPAPDAPPGDPIAPDAGPDSAPSFPDAGSTSPEASPTPPAACTPRVCADYVFDGPSSAGFGVWTPPPGTPLFNSSNGQPYPTSDTVGCGPLPDGCGSTLDCGSCETTPVGSDPCSVLDGLSTYTDAERAACESCLAAGATLANGNSPLPAAGFSGCGESDANDAACCLFQSTIPYTAKSPALPAIECPIYRLSAESTNAAINGGRPSAPAIAGHCY
jgi:hypothetical protein